MFNTVVMLWEKKLKKSYEFCFGNSRFAKDVLLYLKNEVIS